MNNDALFHPFLTNHCVMLRFFLDGRMVQLALAEDDIARLETVLAAWHQERQHQPQEDTP